MSTKKELMAQMKAFGHTPPEDVDGGPKMQENRMSDKKWCYCIKCHALGGLNTRGEIFGLATKSYCVGKKTAEKAVTRHHAIA